MYLLLICFSAVSFNLRRIFNPPVLLKTKDGAIGNRRAG
jgi:hypothetical protein